MGGTTLTSGLGGRGTWTWPAAAAMEATFNGNTASSAAAARHRVGGATGGGRVGGGAAAERDYQYSNLS